MSVERVKNYLKKYNMDDRIITFDSSSATVALAAQALGCEGLELPSLYLLDLEKMLY